VRRIFVVPVKMNAKRPSVYSIRYLWLQPK
jgi:hypothetical protein